MKNKHAVELGRKGGKTRAKNMGKKKLKEWGRKMNEIRWKKLSTAKAGHPKR